MSLIRAVEDPRLEAHITARRELRYSRVPVGYPTHVRAGSSLSWFLGKLAVVQDDTLLVGLIDVASGSVEALDLPLRADGARSFDTERGNKKHKTDLEACFTAPWRGADTLFALGSGSHENRETFAIVQSEPQLLSQLVHLPAFYAALRAHSGFLSTELNLEGAVLLDDQTLRLFQRSNGSLSPGHASASCATCDVEWPELLAYLEAPEHAALPRIGGAQRYDLGRIADGRLTFTDATLRADGSILYSASAESSPNAIDDGIVTGSALGILSEGSARYCLLRDEQGQIALEKAEGLALPEQIAEQIAYVVFDPDDHKRPATLAQVTLSGF